MYYTNGNYSMGGNFKIKKQGPIDDRSTVSKKIDLQNSNLFDGFTYNGMIVSVVDDTVNNGIYRLEDKTTKTWIKEGADSTVELTALIDKVEGVGVEANKVLTSKGDGTSEWLAPTGGSGGDIDLTDYYTKSETYSKVETNSLVATKQDTLVSGNSIKTINGQSVLGNGDIVIGSSASEIDSKIKTKTYYVSNSGLDTNDGLSHLTPFKTIAKALTLTSDYTTLRLECGSVFYEPLVYNNSNLTFESYGVGKKPVIDGSSVIATPTLVSGNVYTTTNTYNTATTSSIRPMILENGVPMQPVGTQAECEALANSYVALVGDGVANGTYSIMFHTSDSVSPLTNGKVYRTNIRDAINPLRDSTSNCTARNLEVRYSVYPTNLPIIGGNGHKIESCNSRYGTKHNIYVSGNSIVKDCVAYGSELQGEYGKTATLFVAYANVANGTESYVFDNCVAIMDLKKQGQVLGSNQIAFLSHCGTGKFKTGKLNNCYSRGCATSFGLSTINVEVNNCYFEKMSNKCIANVSDTTSIKNSFFQRNFIGNSTNEEGDVNYENTTFINHTYANCNTANIVLKNCLFYGGNSIKYQSYMMGTSATSGALSLKMYNTIIFGYQNFTHGVVGTNYEGDYNVFYRISSNQIRAYYNGIQYHTLATWQNATGQDLNSVYLTDAQSKTFFLTDPTTGVITVNPYATVTASNGTVYTGTFPDGTLLTDKFTNKNYSHLKSKYVDELDLLQYQN